MSICICRSWYTLFRRAYVSRPPLYGGHIGTHVHLPLLIYAHGLALHVYVHMYKHTYSTRTSCQKSKKKNYKDKINPIIHVVDSEGDVGNEEDFSNFDLFGDVDEYVNKMDEENKKKAEIFENLRTLHYKF